MVELYNKRILVCFGWEGNRGSNVAPALRHRLCDGINGLRKGDEQPACTPIMSMRLLPLVLKVVSQRWRH